MKVLARYPVVLVAISLALAACSTRNIPLSPHRIDVQQGNALEQEAIEKLKTGMTRSQVRFLLGTPLLVDPFHSNRWDYVYNYRSAGKLTEKKRLTLFFEGDVLARIDGEGLVSQSGPAIARAGESRTQASEKNVQADVPARTLPADEVKSSGAMTASASRQKELANQIEDSLNKTSIVPPLQQPDGQASNVNRPAPVKDSPPESVRLQVESSVETVKPDVIPSFSGASQLGKGIEEQILTALNAWAEAWRSRDEEAYIAAYAVDFRPQGGLSRAEWEKRRRLLLGLSRKIDLKLESVTTDIQGEDKALVIFNQLYRSDSYQDAVIKQLKFVLVDGRWLIEEEKVLGPLKVRK
ncbi:MAG: outer membrane protein assembly factor BamE [Hydrogenophilaceae bacterium]|nr:outer membrane protein assembly factor BamE [Hydrogenophilaceae bacterium]